MTIQTQSKDIFDKTLALLGKKRAVFIPKEGMTEKYGVYRCRKESFHQGVDETERCETAGWLGVLERLINQVDISISY